MGNIGKRSRPEAEPATSPIRLNVGGVIFTTTVDTLTSNSRFFEATLASHHFCTPSEEIFLDRDADAFAVLLSCFRQRSLMPLPLRNNPELCSAVLIEAEYFAADWLLNEAKEKAVRNSVYPNVPFDQPVSGVDDLAADFDQKCGTITQAIERGILPARLLGPAQISTRRITQLLPLPDKNAVDWVVFYRCGKEADRFPPAFYALVEGPGSGTSIEPIIVTRNPPRDNSDISDEHDQPGDPKNQFMTATDWLCPSDHGGAPTAAYDEWAYELVLPNIDDDAD